MNLDPVTLGVVFVLLLAVLGALLLFSWALNPRVRALAWWGSTFCLMAAGIGMANLGPVPVGIPVLLVSNGTVALAYGMLYVGCRLFNERSRAGPAAVAGAALWALAFPVIHDIPGARLTLMSVIAGGYAGFSAWELWWHAPRHLASQRLAVGLLLGLSVFNVLRGMLGISMSSIFWIDAFARRWSAEMAILLVIYGPTLAFVFLSMAKEHLEYDYKQAALVDPLTGVPNRRAFMQAARDLLRRLGDRPASCLLFDLDNFKRVNDSYGHDAGDRILSAFGERLASHLPRCSFGRLGGEEFGAILPLAAPDAVALAETVRQSFACAGEEVLGLPVKVTVSVGCATATGAAAEDLLRQADIALYRAKAGGRNAVVAVAA